MKVISVCFVSAFQLSFVTIDSTIKNNQLLFETVL